MPNDSSLGPAVTSVVCAPVESMPEHRFQVAVVTGGGGGIGRAVARGLASAGYCVAILGRCMEDLAEAARDHAHIAPFCLDVGGRRTQRRCLRRSRTTNGSGGHTGCERSRIPEGSLPGPEPSGFRRDFPDQRSWCGECRARSASGHAVEERRPGDRSRFTRGSEPVGRCVLVLGIQGGRYMRWYVESLPR